MSFFWICFGSLQPAVHVTGTCVLYICCLLWKTSSTVQGHYDHFPNRVLVPHFAAIMALNGDAFLLHISVPRSRSRREYCFHKPLYVAGGRAWVGGTCQSNIHMDPGGPASLSQQSAAQSFRLPLQACLFPHVPVSRVCQVNG